MKEAGLFRITQAHGYILQILLAEILCIRYLPRRKNFLLRILMGGLIFLGLAVVMPNMISQYISGTFSLTVSSKLRILAFLLRSGFPGDFVWLYVGIVYPESVF